MQCRNNVFYGCAVGGGGTTAIVTVIIIIIIIIIITVGLFLACCWNTPPVETQYVTHLLYIR
jgi:hypothetical protein